MGYVNIFANLNKHHQITLTTSGYNMNFSSEDIIAESSTFAVAINSLSKGS